MFDYIKGRVEKAGIRELIHFNTNVRDVRFDPSSKKFEITARNNESDTENTEIFDNVVVASGHFSTPNYPYYPGFESFGGRILHAHDFRDALEFKDQDLLILGTSYSAEDIGSQCWKYGCKSITVAHRTAPMGFNWPDNWKEVPALERVDGETAHFIDGTSARVDSIILCTGYKHHFPFLPDDLRLKTANRLATADLYKGVVWNNNPAIFYLGMQDQWYTFNMFDAQAWYVRDIILGRIELPSSEVMKQDVIDRIEAEDALQDDYGCIDYQGAYTKELISETDYPSFDIEASDKAFYEWKKNKKKDIMGFRDNRHISPMTKTIAPAHHTKWVDALDDSLESYLQTS